MGRSACTFGVGRWHAACRTELHAEKEGSRGPAGLRRNRLRSLLVVAEVALSLLLVVGAGLLIKSFLRLRNVNTGFRPEKVISMSVALPGSNYRTVPQVRSFG